MYKRYMLPTGTGKGKTHSSVPIRGDIAEMKVAPVDLPPEGTKPVMVTSLSDRLKALFAKMDKVMLNPNREEDQWRSGITPHQDPLLDSPEELLALTSRMWRGGMLRETKSENKKDRLYLFTVVKKVSDDGTTVLKLIVDNRLGNLSWR